MAWYIEDKNGNRKNISGVSIGGGIGIPKGGNTDYVLVKKSNADYDTEWVDKVALAEVALDASNAESADYAVEAGNGIPKGGTTGQVLVKKSDDNYDCQWITLSNPNLFDNWYFIKPINQLQLTTYRW